MIDLTPDCEKCAGLCCLALAIDKSEQFSFDKPAGTPCRHLRRDFRCAIHKDLAALGCEGCVSYSCEGAGQRVIQEVFSGQNWQNDPALMRPMQEAFHSLCKLHRLLGLLSTAGTLPLPEGKMEVLEGLANRLGQKRWTRNQLEAFERSDLAESVSRFLQSLRDDLPN